MLCPYSPVQRQWTSELNSAQLTMMLHAHSSPSLTKLVSGSLPTVLMWYLLTSVLPKICRRRLRSPFSYYIWMLSRKHDLCCSDYWLNEFMVCSHSHRHRLSSREGSQCLPKLPVLKLICNKCFQYSLHSKPTYCLLVVHFRGGSVQADLYSQ